MRILVLGDVVGRPGRGAIRELVPSLIASESVDLAMANAENVSGGMGVDVKSAEELFSAGIHVLTSGNHIWKKKEIFPTWKRTLDSSALPTIPPARRVVAGLSGKVPVGCVSW